METIRLRTMARKSVFYEGKFEGYSVQQLIDLKEYCYLRWCYFNCSMVSFLTDILEEIGVSEEFRIDKPGTDLSKFDELTAQKRKSYNGLLADISKEDPKKACLIDKRLKRKKRNLAYIQKMTVMNADSRYFSKAAMQSRNHGRY